MFVAHRHFVAILVAIASARVARSCGRHADTMATMAAKRGPAMRAQRQFTDEFKAGAGLMGLTTGFREHLRINSERSRTSA